MTKAGAPGPEQLRPATTPELPGEQSWRSFVPHTWILTKRLLARSFRDPATVFQAVVIPAIFLAMLNTVLGSQISRFDGHSALYGSVPMTILLGVMSGALAAGVSLGREREDGLLARMWVLPVHRHAGLAARVVAEALRVLATTVVIVATGMALGFRFERGVLAALGFVAVPVVFGIGFAALVMTMSVYSSRNALVEGLSLISSILMFFSTGFVPLAAFPNWIRPVVEHQPMTCAVEAMRALSRGSAPSPLPGLPAEPGLAIASPVLEALAWSLGMLVLFAAPAVIGYRRASRRG